MEMRNSMVVFALVLCIIQGCAARSNFTSPQEDVNVTIGKTNINGKTPIEGEIRRTTFGRYPVKVTKEGSDPIYCYLPLKVSPGHIVLDALFFAPLAFMNVQGSLPYYELDLDSHQVRYRKSPKDPWLSYTISDAENRAARSWFATQIN